jgi:hypothetical protein
MTARVSSGAGLIRAAIRKLSGRPAPTRRRLVVIGLRLPNRSAHFYNELLGYRAAADSLELTIRILVLRSAEPSLAAALSAELVDDALPPFKHITADEFLNQLIAFIHATANLASLWTAIEFDEITSEDMVLFPVAHPVVVASVGAWLAHRAPERRPSVFFRFTGNEIFERASGRTNYAAMLFRLACSELRRWPGQERVFLLTDTLPLARSLARYSCRRAFPMPLPKHWISTANKNLATHTQPIVRVHINGWSGRLVKELGDIVRRVSAAAPGVTFVVNPTMLPPETRASIESEFASLVQVLPHELTADDYFAQLSRCTVVLLAYEPQAYTSGSSGVFVEAAGLGKPVVVPGGTWMAQQIEAGFAVGMTFEESSADSVTKALLPVLKNVDRLGASARDVAARMRTENSCQRYVEKMMTLVQQRPNMEPVLNIDEEIDFSDAIASRCFMREGWGETEDWGVWTTGRRAELCFTIESTQEVVLQALVQPFLTPTHPRIDVRVSAAGRRVAKWTFSLDAPGTAQPHWRAAKIRNSRRADRGDALDVSFAIETPTSPRAEGISADARTLGFGLRKLLIREHP